MQLQEAFEIVDQNCRALLLTSAKGEEMKLINKVAAGKLLGKVSPHPAALGDTSSHQILQADVEKAGLNIARWEEAVGTGLLKKLGEGAGTTYQLPETVEIESHLVPTTLIAHLETVSGMEHANARRIAAKHPGRDGAADKIAGR